MNTGKIFLVNVSKGRIGEDNSALLGGMLITKIQLAAMERVRVPEEERKDFYLYVDEFQNFVTESFASILSEARKYRLNLIIAHQYTNQLVTANGTAVRDAVFGNVGTMIVFRVGAQDAEFLEQEFAPEITPEDLVALPNYNVYLKLMVDGFTSRPFSAGTIPPLKFPGNLVSIQQIVDRSRELYTMPRIEIEETINAWSSAKGGVVLAPGEVPPPDEISEKDKEGKFKANCAICGKEIWLPFEPTPGRPVYCKEDLAKIKSGEIAPVPSKPIPQAQAPQPTQQTPAQPQPAPRPIPQPVERPVRASIDPDTIKSALNDALADVLPAAEDFEPAPKKVPEKQPEVILVKKEKEVFHKPKLEDVKPVTPRPEIQEQKKEMPLEDLRRESNPPERVATKKAGSRESISLLKDVIAKAMAGKPNIAPASYMAAKTEQKKEEPSPVQVEVSLQTEPSKEEEQKKIEEESVYKAENETKIKEVPEDVLKKILE
jgi:CxxC-x17-CxxC domain-containing protein